MKYQKIYDGFQKQADLLLYYQLCRAYMNENCSILRLVEKILLSRLGVAPEKDNPVTRAINAVRGQHDPVISLPKFEFEAKVSEILAEFVEKKFDVMVFNCSTRLGSYPLKFRDIIERYSE